MGMTLTEKILAAHAGMDAVKPGMIVEARVDVAMAHDVTGPIAIEEFRKAGARRVFDRHRIVLVCDHFTPSKDIEAARNCKILREFAREQDIRHFYDGGSAGICHVLLPEQGLVVPGDLVIGADSHTCTYGALGAFATGVGSTDLAAVMITGKIWLRVPETIKVVLTGDLRPWVCGKDIILHIIGKLGVEGANYKALEFTGAAVGKLTMADRFTIANMVVEAGAKNGIFAVDEVTEEFVREHGDRDPVYMHADPDARYTEVIHVDLGDLEPQVAFPPLPSNVKGISQVGSIPIDQVYIGSCTNGRIEDLRVAARLLRGRKVARGVRLIVAPATPSVYRMALQEGLLEVFLDAGAVISPPTCGPCLGGHMGVLAEGERAVSTTNRNFVGRMGHRESEVYLTSPAIAAASAVIGRIAAPEELKGVHRL